jgi:hypothetical protein
MSDGRPRPHIASVWMRLAHLRRDVLLLRVAERPDFVALNPPRLQAAHVGIVVRLAGRANVTQQLFDGHARHASQASGGSEAVAFDQSGYDGGAFLCAQTARA